MENKLNIELTENEVNYILGVLGELPTKSMVFPLVMNIKQQAESQLPQKTDAE